MLEVIFLMKTKSITFTAPCIAELIESEIGAPQENEVQVKLVVLLE